MKSNIVKFIQIFQCWNGSFSYTHDEWNPSQNYQKINYKEFEKLFGSQYYFESSAELFMDMPRFFDVVMFVFSSFYRQLSSEWFHCDDCISCTFPMWMRTRLTGIWIEMSIIITIKSYIFRISFMIHTHTKRWNQIKYKSCTEHSIDMFLSTFWADQLLATAFINEKGASTLKPIIILVGHRQFTRTIIIIIGKGHFTFQI